MLCLCIVFSLQATSQLSSALKAEAALMSDSTSQTKLLTAAKLLADATARMVEAAKVKIKFCCLNHNKVFE